MKAIGAAALVCLAMTQAGLGARQLDACTVLSPGEIAAALGRKDIAPGKAARASGGYSDCRFAASGSGDVRVILSPPLPGA